MSNPNAAISFPRVFKELQAGDLSPDTVQKSFDAILAGAWNSVQIGGFLAALRTRGETAGTIAAAARSMRNAMVPVTREHGDVLDTCGTGGDGQGTVNLSTGAAIICAALGITVAKHGNRAISSKSGSADVLEALGVPMDLPVSAAATLLHQQGIAFMPAPMHHPALRFAMPVRQELKVRTIFNCLGPLANPAGASHQLVGAFADELRPIMAQTLAELGSRRAWVVRGEDGLDEISPYGPTRVTQLSDGKLKEFVVRPEDFGVPTSEADAAIGGDSKLNATILKAVLGGDAHPSRDAFVINAAAAIVVARGVDMKAAAAQVQDILQRGVALEKLHSWVTAANQLRAEV